MNKIFRQLMDVRNLSDDFLMPKYENLTAPEKLPDVKKAVDRLKKAKKQGEKVLVYGDYDVDGVTATTIIHDTLELMGITDTEMMLPDRFIDGYGMSKRLVERAKETGASLVVTVDCGSNNGEIVDELNKLKIDTIVTDHHEISGDLPKAVAVINPKRLSGEAVQGLVELSGAGVAFMLARALVNAGEIPAGQEKWLLDLAMIGTICDSMVLLHDNRIICHYGMIVLAKTRRVGLKALMHVAGVNKINTEAIGFQLGPRLNAAGRMETAELALNLLMTKSKVEAARLADELNRLNNERREQQNQAVAEVEAKDISAQKVIVVQGKWGEGVVGIIAGRLTEKYKRPSFVLTETEDVLKGSGRSFGEFNLALALRECQDLIISGGGHAAACGLSIEKTGLEAFSKGINEYYESLGLKNQERFLDVREDVTVDDFSELDLELMGEIEKLEPFGEGNPTPVFLLTDMLVLRADKIGTDGKHLRMLLGDKNGKSMKLIAFSAPEEWLNLRAGARVNAWVELTENEWQGTRSVEGRILKIGLEL